MNIEELRKYAAVEILGAEKAARVGGLELYNTYEFEDWHVFEVDWHPDTDRDQLWLVLKKLNEDHGTVDKPFLTSRNERNELEIWCCIDSLAMREPAKALEAICKAHQETKR